MKPPGQAGDGQRAREQPPGEAWPCTASLRTPSDPHSPGSPSSVIFPGSGVLEALHPDTTNLVQTAAARASRGRRLVC